MALFSFCATWGAASCTKEDLFCLCLDGSWVSGEKILGSSERRRNVSALILKHWLKFCSLVRNKGNLHEGVFGVTVDPSSTQGFSDQFSMQDMGGGGSEDFENLHAWVLRCWTTTEVKWKVSLLELKSIYLSKKWNFDFLYFFLSERRMPCPFPVGITGNSWAQWHLQENDFLMYACRTAGEAHSSACPACLCVGPCECWMPSYLCMLSDGFGFFSKSSLGWRWTKCKISSWKSDQPGEYTLGSLLFCVQHTGQSETLPFFQEPNVEFACLVQYSIFILCL